MKMLRTDIVAICSFSSMKKHRENDSSSKKRKKGGGGIRAKMVC